MDKNRHIIFKFQTCAFVLPAYEEEVSESSLWHPPEGSNVKTREEWLRTHGLGEEQFAQLKEKIELIATKQTDAGMLPKVKYRKLKVDFTI